MSRSLLIGSLLVIVLSSLSIAVSMGCHGDATQFGTPLYVDEGDNPFGTPQRYIVAIAVTPSGVNIAVGGLQQFQAIATFNDGTTENIAAAVEWVNENPAIGMFEPAGGRFLAKKPGVAIIRCRFEQAGHSVISTASYINSFNPDANLPPAVPLNPEVTANDEGVLVNWDINMTDGDLAGYNIWRTQVSASHYATDFGRVNDNLILYPPYLDRSVVSGWYFYRITAEDLMGIDSAPSEEVAVFITGMSHYGGAYDADTAGTDDTDYGDAFSTGL
jgi:hypothetical protein